MPDIPTASWLEIPPWLDKRTPGAADKARDISTVSDLTKRDRARLQQFVNAEAVWREVKRQGTIHKLSQAALQNAAGDLLTTAFYAAKWQPVGEAEAAHERRRLDRMSAGTARWAIEFSEDARDPQLIGLWHIYRDHRRDNALLQALPDDLTEVGKSVHDIIADYCQRAAPHYKPEGPVPIVGKPRRKEAHKTTVIHKLAEICVKHFGTPLCGTIAKLANIALGRTDIGAQTVRKSLPRTLP